MNNAIEQLIERDLFELLAGDQPPDLQLAIMAKARSGDFTVSVPTELTSTVGGRAMRYLAAACAVLAIGALGWVMWPQPLPATVTASKGASYFVADDHIQLNKGWLLLNEGAPEVRSDGDGDQISVNGRGVIGLTIPDKEEINSLVNELNLNTKEREMLNMKNRWVIATGLALCLFSGHAVINDKSVSAEDLPKPEEVVERKSGTAADIATADNTFGFKLFRQMHAEGENTLISPTSFCVALHMANEGAAGETRTEIEKAMGIEGIDPREANKSLLAALNGRQDVTLNVANSLWADPSRVSINADYVSDLQKYFDATARAADFSDPKTVDVINDWIAKKTNNLITKMLDKTDPETVSYLINAIYFKGSWTKTFEKAKTKEAEFTLKDGSTKRVKMMYQKDHFTYADASNAQVCRLPYGKDKKTAMWIVLPKADTSLGAVIADLDSEQLSKWKKAAANKKVALRLPRFTLGYKKMMNESLKAVGIKKAFDPAQANFTNVGESTSGNNIFLGRVLHETKIIVTEEGTEAAAATVAENRERSSSIRMTCDRPFLFLITDEDTGAVLFVGSCYNPSDVE